MAQPACSISTSGLRHYYELLFKRPSESKAVFTFYLDWGDADVDIETTDTELPMPTRENVNQWAIESADILPLQGEANFMAPSMLYNMYSVRVQKDFSVERLNFTEYDDFYIERHWNALAS